MSNEKLTLSSILASLDEEGVVKQASEQVAPSTTQPVVSGTAQELEKLLTKQATEVKNEMSNPNQQGKAIADSVLSLIKKASNQVITQTEAQQAQSSAGIQETPREGASITNTLQGIVAKGFATGAVRADALDEHLDNGGDEGHGGQAPTYSSDGHPTHALEGEDDDEVEKTAALITLVDNGVDFDTAVDLIKQAEEEILADEYEHTKQAAVSALLEEGMDIESAIELVKAAMFAEEEMAKQAGARIDAAKASVGRGYNYVKGKAIAGKDAVKAKGLQAGTDVRNMVMGGEGVSRMEAAKNLAKNPLVYGTAAAGAVGGGAYYMNKRASIVALMDEGFSAEEAISLTKEAGKIQEGVDAVKGAAGKVWEGTKGYARSGKEDVKALWAGGAEGTRKNALKNLAKNPLTYAAAGGAGAAGYGISRAMSNEKQAAEAIGYLVDQGYSVQQALEMLSN